ncbi:hypothetical protein EG829_29430, partial [bacterium]|nr:hypothetical protein [bacterium]
NNRGFTLGLYSLPGASLTGHHFTQAQIEEANGAGYWPLETGVEREQTTGWLAFLDPFKTDAESWLRSWNEAYAPVPILGGLASGSNQESLTQVYLNGEVYEEGGVGISFSGAVKLVGVTSQGCTPIGETWTLTRVQHNVVQEIGNRRAYDVLAETFGSLSPEEQLKARGNLFIGLAVNEYLEDFHRGDFLIRNLMAADAGSGSLAVGALPRMGQTVQFQRRSAAGATEDLKDLLERAKARIGSSRVHGGCLCICNGRGTNLFGTPSHDARMVSEAFGLSNLVGFFCNGEIGPVGNQSYLHGYTASLGLFVERRDQESP